MLALSESSELPASSVADDLYFGETMKTIQAAAIADVTVKESSNRHLDFNTAAISIRLKEDCIEKD